MKRINHINLKNVEDQVYCCLRNKIVDLTEQHLVQYCHGCQMFAGTAQGKGIECSWNDARHVSNPHIVLDPHVECRENQMKQVRLHGLTHAM